ncbi:hypothetical protein COC46_20865 [Bacillus sp. AFS041924]|nr:hypothetical protein COC46_20865 [Bacillus sp. AFS041924]
MVQARKQTCIPSVWTEDELKKLIAAIDRGSPKGKRDYAIILMACCLGLRCTDIKNLKMENFHWEDKKLVFYQSKTRQLLTLPLTPEVGWAVIDYLKYGRPKINSPYLFVKHIAPFGPFSEGDHLNQLIKRYMELAHISSLKKRRGMHSLRHTLASMLLEKDTPLSTISDILGHVDTDTTAVYLKVDIKKLKECSLDFEEVLNLSAPSHQECAESYLVYLAKKIIDNENNAIDFAYEMYKTVREHFIDEELSVWYEISEMIDDYRYGDNIGKITKEVLVTKIVEEAKKHINL